MKLLLSLLAVASWVGSALLADEGVISPPLCILLSALGWFFVIIAIGGKKGAVVGIGILVFAACAVGLLVKMPQIPRDFLPYTTLKPGSFFFWFGVLASTGLTLVIPCVLMVKLWKRLGREKKDATKEKEVKEEGKTKRGFLEPSAGM